jgi:ABC-type branched-subunit amino acid transport system substrate-binding protein
MSSKHGWRRLGILLVVLGLLAAGCRSGEDTAATGEGEEEATAADTGGATAEEGSEAADGEIATDVGVTEEPCPEAVNPDNGCIYLGTISDLTQGPFSALGQSIVESQAAFWNAVNEDGGIGGYDVDVSTYVRDNLYNPETHNQVYQEIKGDVLALAQTLGSPTTAAIIGDLNAEGIIGAPASWTSAWEFEDVILESGANYCIESMNSIDYAVENFDGIQSVTAIHYAGDYGDDAAAGARIAAEANGLEFTDVETPTGPDNQAGAIDALVNGQPSLAIITTGPTDMATIVGQAVARGFTGQVIGTSPTWNPGVVQSPAFPAVEQVYIQSAPWLTYSADTPGHQAMREAIGTEEGNDGFTSGWAWSYPLLAALQAAAENGDLTREGVLQAAQELETVDYQGMLPEEAGNFSGSPSEQAFRGTVFSQPDAESSTGVSSIVEEHYFGPTAQDYELSEPCFQSAG